MDTAVKIGTRRAGGRLLRCVDVEDVVVEIGTRRGGNKEEGFLDEAVADRVVGICVDVLLGIVADRVAGICEDVLLLERGVFGSGGIFGGRGGGEGILCGGRGAGGVMRGGKGGGGIRGENLVRRNGCKVCCGGGGGGGGGGSTCGGGGIFASGTGGSVGSTFIRGTSNGLVVVDEAHLSILRNHTRRRG